MLQMVLVDPVPLQIMDVTNHRRLP